MSVPRPTRDAGVTLVELMVAVTISGIAAGFIFSVYARVSTSYDAQARVAEVQQTLRSCVDILAKDLRNTGYLGRTLVTAPGTLAALRVVNRAENEGSDSITLAWADAGRAAQVAPSGPAFNAAVTQIVACTPDPYCGFADGDVVVAVRTKPSLSDYGQACVLKLTGLVPGGPKLQHNPGQGAPWNQPGNTQCSALQASWADGYTLFTRLGARAYRINPTDLRGILEVSPSGGLIASDWQPLAQGIVDLQVALRVYKSAGADLDGDGDVTRDWISGENMEAVNPADVLQVRLSVVARNPGDLRLVGPSRSPDFCTPGRMDNNNLGDHCGVDGTAAPPTSRYAGNHVYRGLTETIDLRNLRTGTGTLP